MGLPQEPGKKNGAKCFPIFGVRPKVRSMMFNSKAHRPRVRFPLAGIFSVSLIAQAANVDYFTDNGFGNVSSTMQHPTGQYYQGTTYLAYQGPHEDSYVCAYNHAGRKWSGPVLAGVSLMGKTPDPIDNSELDNHGKPAMMVDVQGYIHVVFGAHGGSPLLGVNTLGTPAGSVRGAKLTHLVSRKPQDISSWQVLDNIPPFGTYPQFVQTDSGDVYLFYRHGAHRSDWVYQKSVDNGRTFAPEVSIIKHKPQAASPTTHDAWYAWFAKGLGDTITASYVYHPCANPGHTSARHNVYYMQLNCGNGSWENVAGEHLSVPVTKEYADAKSLVFNTGTDRCNHGTCRVDAEGHPHLIFRYAKGQVRYSRWTGSVWTGPTAIVPDGGSQDGDLIVESPTQVRVILASSGSSRGEVGWWNTADGGQTWSKQPPLLSRTGGGFGIGALVENFIPSGMFIVSEAVSSQHLYKKMMLMGRDGPVKRPEEEADIAIKNLLEIIKSGPLKSGATQVPVVKRSKKQKKEGRQDEE